MLGIFVNAAAIVAVLAAHPVSPVRAEESMKYAQAAPSSRPSPSPPVQTQPAPPPQAQPGTPAQPAPSTPDAGFSEQVLRLQNFLEERRSRLDQLGADIAKGLQTEQQANEIFDRMARSFKELNDRIGAESEYRKSLDEIVKRSRQNAKDFAQSQDPQIRELAKKEEGRAASVEQLQTDTNAEYARGVATLRRIEEGRALAIARIKSAALDAAAKAAKDYLDVIRDAITNMEKFNESNKARVPGS